MKILLVKPPPNGHIMSLTRYEPLEFEYLAASVPDHNSDIFDMRIEKNLLRKIETFKPDLVGITAYSCDVRTTKSIAREIKTHDRRIRTVVGGNHATFMPEDFNDGSVDTIFLGYADHTFPRYVEALQSGTDLREIENLALAGDEGLYFTQKKPVLADLDSLPLPARHLTEKHRHKYHDSIRNTVSLVMSSRGCPFRCTFCACWKLMDGKYRTRKVDSIIQELESLPDDVPMVYFSDDNTVHDIVRAQELADKIVSRGIRKKLQMYARVDSITRHPDLFRSLREAGLEYLTVGFESITDDGLKKINKRTTVQMNNEAILILKKLGIHINAHFLVDPDFARQDFRSLLQYVEDRRLFRPAYPVLTPLPGTELYEETRETHVIRDFDYFDFAHSILPTKLPRKEFYLELARLYRNSYSPRRYLRHLLRRNEKDHSRKPDGISFLQLLAVWLFAFVPYLRMKNAHRSEPLTNTR